MLKATLTIFEILGLLTRVQSLTKDWKINIIHHEKVEINLGDSPSFNAS